MNVAIVTTYAHKVHYARSELLNQLKNAGCQITIMGPEKEELSLSELKKLGMNYVQIDIKRVNLNPIREIQSLNDIKKKLIVNNIDSLLIYGIRMVPSVALAAKFAKVKRIVCVINGAGNLLMAKGIKGRFVQAISYPLLALTLRKVNTAIFQNKDDYSDLKRMKLVSDKNVKFTNGSGVNTDIYKKRPLPDKPEFLLVTRVTGSKGVNEYIKAARLVKEKYPSARFGLVGPKDDTDGSIDWNTLEEAVKEGTLQYHGETSDVMKYLEDCRIYVFPSYYREGVPRSVLEAMAVGRPVITTKAPGCKETVIEGRNGLFVPPKDVKALADKMTWMIENTQRVEVMAEESRKIAVEKFNVHKVNDTITKELIRS